MLGAGAVGASATVTAMVRSPAVADDPILGYGEIADMLHVKTRTVTQWGFRGLLPPPDQLISRMPTWRRSTILLWADSQGRLRHVDSRKLFKRLFDREAREPRVGGRLPADVAPTPPAKKTPAKRPAKKPAAKARARS